MPNVNTLIVNQADRFGLTQLHSCEVEWGVGRRWLTLICCSIKAKVNTGGGETFAHDLRSH